MQNYLYGRNKFDFAEFKDVPLYEYFNKLTEVQDITYENKPQPMPGSENVALKFFMDLMAKPPSASEIKDTWPLTAEAFQV